MRKLSIALGVMLAIGVACSTFGQVTPLQAASTVSQSFFLTAAGTTPTLTIAGQLKCMVQVNAPTGTFSSVPQFSTDGFSSSIDTGTWINGGLIGQNGVYIGTNPGSPNYTSFRLNINAFSGPQISGQIVCGDTLPPASNGGGGGGVSSVAGGLCISATPSVGDVVVSYSCPEPSPQVPPSAGNCIGVSTPPAVGTIAYTCATPGPQDTQSPIPVATTTAGAGSFTITGSYPYTHTVSFPIGGGATPVPTSTPLDVVVLAETSALHFWKMNDAAGCLTVADAIAGGATAAPSPVPLPTAGTVTCGAPGLSNDGETSIQFPGTTSDYLVLPNGTAPASGSYSIEFAVFDVGGASATPNFIDLDTNAHLNIGSSTPAESVTMYNGSSSSGFQKFIPKPFLIDVTWDGTTTKQYVDSTLVFSSAGFVAGHQNASGLIGKDAGGSNLFYGRMSKLSIYNTALTQAQVNAHYSAFKCAGAPVPCK